MYVLSAIGAAYLAFMFIGFLFMVLQYDRLSDDFRNRLWSEPLFIVEYLLRFPYLMTRRILRR